MVSFLKAMWGPAATAENNFAFDYLPKLDVPSYDVLRAFELMNQGKMTAYFCQGFNPLQAFPNKAKIASALSKLKLLVVMDPLDTETARFWENHGEYNNADPSKIQTEVIQLPTTCFAEDEGALVNSGRWLQWHWAGGSPPGDAKSDTWILAQIFLRLKKLYQTEGGTFPDPILNLTWPYKNPDEPTPEELAKEMNGYALADVFDPERPDEKDPGKRQADRWIRGAARRRDHGERLLDLFRLLHRGRQYDGAAGQFRPGRHRRLSQMVVRVAGQPPHPLQPSLVRHRRQALGPVAQADRVGRRQMDGL